MIALFILAALLLLVTLWWLSRPLRAGAAVSTISERVDLEQLRDRLVAQLNELDAERADRGIDSAVAQDEELRLSTELASAVKRLEGLAPSASGAVSTLTNRNALVATAVLALMLLAIGVGLYAWQNAGNVQGFMLTAGSGADNTRVPPLVFEMVAKLEKRLAAQPNDPEGWARLGRSYVVMERKDKALAAYAKAYELAPDNVAVLSDYAWLVFNENPGATTGLVQTLYSHLYQLEPTHPDALWFMGFTAYQQGDYRKALGLWERLLKLLPAEDPGREQLAQAIASAREKLRR
jgi:cytochrome c-type biogenesis protein CcmH